MTKDFSIKPYVKAQAGVLSISVPENFLQTGKISKKDRTEDLVFNAGAGGGLKLEKGNFRANADAIVGTDLMDHAPFLANGTASYKIDLNDTWGINFSANAQYAQRGKISKERELNPSTENGINIENQVTLENNTNVDIDESAINEIGNLLEQLPATTTPAAPVYEEKYRNTKMTLGAEVVYSQKNDTCTTECALGVEGGYMETLSEQVENGLFDQGVAISSKPIVYPTFRINYEGKNGLGFGFKLGQFTGVSTSWSF